MEKYYIYKGTWENGVYGIDHVRMSPGVECPKDKIEWIENTTREYRLIQKYMGELCQKQLIS